MAAFTLFPEAGNDLEAIWHYRMEHWGVDQAHQYIDALDQAFQLLTENPLIGRERNEFTQIVYTHQHASHLIVYARVNTNIAIVRVLHASMDVETQLEL